MLSFYSLFLTVAGFVYYFCKRICLEVLVLCCAVGEILLDLSVNPFANDNDEYQEIHDNDENEEIQELIIHDDNDNNDNNNDNPVDTDNNDDNDIQELLNDNDMGAFNHFSVNSQATTLSFHDTNSTLFQSATNSSVMVEEGRAGLSADSDVETEVFIRQPRPNAQSGASASASTSLAPPIAASSPLSTSDTTNRKQTDKTKPKKRAVTINNPIYKATTATVELPTRAELEVTMRQKLKRSIALKGDQLRHFFGMTSDATDDKNPDTQAKTTDMTPKKRADKTKVTDKKNRATDKKRESKGEKKKAGDKKQTVSQPALIDTTNKNLDKSFTLASPGNQLSAVTEETELKEFSRPITRSQHKQRNERQQPSVQQETSLVYENEVTMVTTQGNFLFSLLRLF